MGQKTDTNDQLATESERVLADRIFTRAPVQSRLLRFLVNRTLAGKAPPTQFEIAVDGLGRHTDYDLDSDSYPRVQISRLRKNLEKYYVRPETNKGLRLQLDPGTYSLTVIEHDGSKVEERALNLPSPDKPAAHEREARHRSKTTTRQIGTAVLGVIGLVTLPIYLLGVAPATDVEAAAREKPFTRLVVNGSEFIDRKPLFAGLYDAALQTARIQLANSFVSKPLAAHANARDAQYTVTLNFGPADEDNPVLQVVLADQDGDVIYLDKLSASKDVPNLFMADLEASLIYITSPTGAIAQAELPKVKNVRATDYSCFLTIENHRSQGAKTAKLVDDCIARFPESGYRSFWHARRAFSAYQREIVAGRQIAKAGPAWTDLKIALSVDRYNAFANFTAAKVELAHGNCAAARGYVDRALKRASSYPALIAALETNAAACASTAPEREALAARIRALGKHNPEPDPLLQLYLVIASLAADDLETAKLVANRVMIEEPEGRIEETQRLLSRALSHRSVAIERRKQLIEAIRIFVWNDEATSAIVAKLIE